MHSHGLNAQSPKRNFRLIRSTEKFADPLRMPECSFLVGKEKIQR